MMYCPLGVTYTSPKYLLISCKVPINVLLNVYALDPNIYGQFSRSGLPKMEFFSKNANDNFHTTVIVMLHKLHYPPLDMTYQS